MAVREQIIQWVDRGQAPDWIARLGIRRLLRERLRDEQRRELQRAELVKSWREGPIAVATEKANEQHYELPAAFFERVLGRRRKYSCAYWVARTQDLNEAEERMLELTGHRAELADGLRILELGCGWGSLTLWMAERFPRASIVAMSNSHSQREYILAQARERGLRNLEVITSDINEFEPEGRFDRVVSVEMMEHVRNHQALFERIGRWLTPEGRLFVHVFCHRRFTYPFEAVAADDWMGRHFFTGGLMPAFDYLVLAQDVLALETRWMVNGRHYALTAHSWRERLDRHREEILPILADVYGRGEEELWHARWRIFFMACEELFGYRGGREWFVGHYLFHR
ncbi:MAG: cyclopropane-fatty-acyl-phospholipid synthase family protein [Acidobacteriota bacterium]